MKRLLLFFVLIFFLNIAFSCTIPTYRMTINSETEFCSGTYVFNSLSLYRDPALTITGSNFNVICNNTTIILKGDSMGFFVNIKNADHVNLTNCKFIEERRFGRNGLIAVTSSTNLNIVSNTILNERSGGINLDQNSNYNNIINNSIYNVSVGIDVSSQGNVIVNNTIYNTTLKDIRIVKCNNTLQNNTGSNILPIIYINTDNTILQNRDVAQIIVCANNTTIQNVNLTLTPFRTNGIDILAGQNNTIKNSYLENTHNSINIFRNAQHTTIKNNYLSNPYTILYVEANSVDTDFDSNTVMGGSGSPGIRINGPTNIHNNVINNYTGNFEILSESNITNNNLTSINLISINSQNVLFSDNFIKNILSDIQISNSNDNITNNTILNSGNYGLHLLRFSQNTNVINNIICYSSNKDLYDEGTNNNFDNNMCSTSSPTGLCAEACRIIDVDIGVSPPVPTTTDTIRCRAYPHALNNVTVEFRVYINGIHNESYDTNESCSSTQYCYSPSFGPFEEGTVISCEARAHDEVMDIYSDWKMSSATEIQGESNSGGTNNKRNLPLIVSYDCISPNQAILHIFSEPDTQLTIFGDIVSHVLLNETGIYNLNVNIGEYSITAKKTGYKTQSRNVYVTCTSCTNNYQCSDTEVCINRTCQQLQCGYCQYVEQHTCKNFECCKDNQCDDNQICNANTCINLNCSDNEIAINHTCIGINQQNNTQTNNSVTNNQNNEQINQLINEVKYLRDSINTLKNEQKRPTIVPNLPWWLVLLIASSVLLGILNLLYLYKLKQKENIVEGKEVELEHIMEDLTEEIRKKKKK